MLTGFVCINNEVLNYTQYNREYLSIVVQKHVIILSTYSIIYLIKLRSSHVAGKSNIRC